MLAAVDVLLIVSILSVVQSEWFGHWVVSTWVVWLHGFTDIKLLLCCPKPSGGVMVC